MKTIFFLQLVATLIFNLVSIRILEKKKNKTSISGSWYGTTRQNSQKTASYWVASSSDYYLLCYMMNSKLKHEISWAVRSRIILKMYKIVWMDWSLHQYTFHCSLPHLHSCPTTITKTSFGIVTGTNEKIPMQDSCYPFSISVN